MNKSHREIKGETFTERVNPPKPKNVDVGVRKIPKRPMFKSILQKITKPFRSKPTIDYDVYRDKDKVIAGAQINWYFVDAYVAVIVDTGLDGDKFKVRFMASAEGHDFINEVFYL